MDTPTSRTTAPSAVTSIAAIQEGARAFLDRSGLLEEIPCNLCGSTDVRVLQEAQDVIPGDGATLTDTFSSSSDERLKHQLVACAECGLQYVSPRPRAEAVLEGYSRGSDEQFVSQARGRELTFDKCLDIIERVRRGPRGRILDIGTGNGSFLHVASKRGWRTAGCEPNRWLCEWAKKHYHLTVQAGTVFDQRYRANSFDVVTLWDVLEHTPDPKMEITEAQRLLKEDGLLVVNYPDIGSWIARLMGRSWVFLLDVHLYYFTRTTIAKLLANSGLEVVTLRPHYQRLSLGYILRRSEPYVGQPARIAGRLAAAMRLSGLHVPYWMGQRLVIARKRRPTAEATSTA